jgi:hypothetical protein
MLGDTLRGGCALAALAIFRRFGRGAHGRERLRAVPHCNDRNHNNTPYG